MDWESNLNELAIRFFDLHILFSRIAISALDLRIIIQKYKFCKLSERITDPWKRIPN